MIFLLSLFVCALSEPTIIDFDDLQDFEISEHHREFLFESHQKKWLSLIGRMSSSCDIFMKKDGPASETEFDYRTERRSLEFNFLIDNAEENTGYFLSVHCPEEESQISVLLSAPTVSQPWLRDMKIQPFNSALFQYNSADMPIEVILKSMDCNPKLYVRNLEMPNKQFNVIKGINYQFLPLLNNFNSNYIIQVMQFEDRECSFEVQVRDVLPMLVEESEPSWVNMDSEHKYFLFDGEEDHKTTLKVDGNGHYIVNVTKDSTQETFEVYTKYRHEIIPDININSGGEHFLILEAQSGQNFCVSVLLHSFDVHYLLRDQAYEKLSIGEEEIVQFALELPESMEPLEIISRVIVEAGSVNVYSELCNATSFSSCFFRGNAIKNSVAVNQNREHTRVVKQVQDLAYVSYGVEVGFWSDLCFLTVTIKGLAPISEFIVMGLHEERIGEELFEEKSEFQLDRNYKHRFRYETRSAGLSAVAVTVLETDESESSIQMAVDRLYPDMRSHVSNTQGSQTYRFTAGLEGVYFLELEIPGVGDPADVEIIVQEERDFITPYSLAQLGSIWDHTTSGSVYYLNINQTYRPQPIRIELTPIDQKFELCIASQEPKEDDDLKCTDTVEHKEDYVIVVEPTDPIYIPVGTYTVLVKVPEQNDTGQKGVFKISYNKESKAMNLIPSQQFIQTGDQPIGNFNIKVGPQQDLVVHLRDTANYKIKVMDERLENNHARTSTGTVVFVSAEAMSDYINKSIGWVDVTLEAVEQATELIAYINEVSVSELERHQQKEIDNTDNSPAVFNIPPSEEEIYLAIENIVGKIHISWNHAQDEKAGRPLISDLIEAEQDINQGRTELKFSSSDQTLIIAVSWLDIPCSFSIGFSEKTGYTYTKNLEVEVHETIEEYTEITQFSEHEHEEATEDEESSEEEDYIAFFVFSGLLLAIILLLTALICVIVKKNKANYEVVNATDSQLEAV